MEFLQCRLVQPTKQYGTVQTFSIKTKSSSSSVPFLPPIFSFINYSRQKQHIIFQLSITACKQFQLQALSCLWNDCPDGTSVRKVPGLGPGPLQSNIPSVCSQNIFWIGLSPCAASALLFLLISY